MPVVRYIAWVGTSLVALLFLADWLLPKSLPEPGPDTTVKPAIRITSVQQAPDRVVIDTSQPTIIPPPMPVEVAGAGKSSPLQSYASADPSPTIAEINQKKQRFAKRRVVNNAIDRPRFNNTSVASSSGAITAQSTKLSLLDFISRLKKTLSIQN